jgi:hypothetical protein
MEIMPSPLPAVMAAAIWWFLIPSMRICSAVPIMNDENDLLLNEEIIFCDQGIS